MVAQMSEVLADNLFGELYPLGEYSLNGASLDVFISPESYEDHVGLYREHLSRTPRVREVGDSELQYFLMNAWEGRRMPATIHELVRTNRTCLISSHGTISNDHWVTKVGKPGKYVNVADLVDDAHQSGYELILLTCCNESSFDINPEHGRVVYPNGIFGAGHKFQMKLAG